MAPLSESKFYRAYKRLGKRPTGMKAWEIDEENKVRIVSSEIYCRFPTGESTMCNKTYSHPDGLVKHVKKNHIAQGKYAPPRKGAPSEEEEEKIADWYQAVMEHHDAMEAYNDRTRAAMFSEEQLDSEEEPEPDVPTDPYKRHVPTVTFSASEAEEESDEDGDFATPAPKAKKSKGKGKQKAPSQQAVDVQISRVTYSILSDADLARVLLVLPKTRGGRVNYSKARDNFGYTDTRCRLCEISKPRACPNIHNTSPCMVMNDYLDDLEHADQQVRREQGMGSDSVSEEDEETEDEV